MNRNKLKKEGLNGFEKIKWNGFRLIELDLILLFSVLDFIKRWIGERRKCIGVAKGSGWKATGKNPSRFDLCLGRDPCMQHVQSSSLPSYMWSKWWNFFGSHFPLLLCHSVFLRSRKSDYIRRSREKSWHDFIGCVPPFQTHCSWNSSK